MSSDEEFGAGADMDAALADSGVAGTVPEPEPELDVGGERVGLPVKLLAAEAREHFWAFRKFIHPDLIEGWWQVDVAEHLDQFYRDYVAGKRPKLVLCSPPQHGKVCADETPVLTSSGWKLHGDLKVGDRVFHPSGWTTRVVATYQKMPTRVRVELTNGELIYVHEEHLWTVHNRYALWEHKKTPQTLETRWMLERGVVTGTPGKRGCRYMFQFPFVESLFGEEKNLPADPAPTWPLPSLIPLSLRSRSLMSGVNKSVCFKHPEPPPRIHAEALQGGGKSSKGAASAPANCRSFSK